MTYQEIKAIQKELDLKLDKLSDKLNSFPKSSMGLVTEEARTSDEYAFAKRAYNKVFKDFREVNIYMTRNFKKEMAKEREEKRAKFVRKS